jgi:hypothetical protein
LDGPGLPYQCRSSTATAAHSQIERCQYLLSVLDYALEISSTQSISSPPSANTNRAFSTGTSQ